MLRCPPVSRQYRGGSGSLDKTQRNTLCRPHWGRVVTSLRVLLIRTSPGLRVHRGPEEQERVLGGVK
jgi:hypothetical protein